MIRTLPEIRTPYYQDTSINQDNILSGHFLPNTDTIPTPYNWGSGTLVQGIGYNNSKEAMITTDQRIVVEQYKPSTKLQSPV